jgi:hypothetical protein
VKRFRDDSVKPGCGIDDDLGADYTKKYNVPDMQDAYPGNIEVSEQRDTKGRRVRVNAGHAAYSDDDAGLTRTDNFEGPDSSYYAGSGSRQIWEDVEANQNPGDEFDTTGPIKAGVNRSQS